MKNKEKTMIIKIAYLFLIYLLYELSFKLNIIDLSYLGMFFIRLIFLILSFYLFNLLFHRNSKKISINFTFNKNILVYSLSLLFFVALFGRILAPTFDNFVYPTFSNWSFIIPALIAILLEEISYRGVFQSILQNTVPFFLVLFVLSINFTLGHLGWLNVVGTYNLIIQLITVFLATALLIFVFYLTKSILMTFLIHLLINALTIFQIYLHMNYPVIELIFWVVWGIFALFFVKYSLNWITTELKKHFKRVNFNKNSTLLYILLILLAFFPFILFLTGI